MSRKHDNPRDFDPAFSHWCWNWRPDLRATPGRPAETGLKLPVPMRRTTPWSALVSWLERWIFARAPSPARREALEAFFVSLGAAAEAGDRASYTDLFLPDATVFLPDRPPLLGRDQIGDWFDAYRQSVVLRLDCYRHEQISVVGAVAMIRSRGTGHFLVRATEERFPFDRRYLDVLQYCSQRWYMAYHVESGAERGVWDRGPDKRLVHR